MTSQKSGASTPKVGRDRVRGARGQYVKSADTAERDAAAARLRTDGLGYQEIADRLGFTSAGTAHEAARRALEATRREGGEELRKYELDRLDVLYQAALAVLRREHLAHGNGRVVERLNPATGQMETLLDSGPILAAIGKCLDIQARRAKLMGLDAPTRHSVDADALGREILAMLQQAPASGPDPDRIDTDGASGVDGHD